nr:RNA-directed DNA polymerase, eukaryota [Tanacetum cinerariifolium]
MDGVGNSETTSKTRLSRSEINSIKRQEKNEVFSKNNGDKTTNSIPSQKADHVGSSQNKKTYASSLNGDKDSKVEKQVTAVKGNTISNVPLTPSLITQALEETMDIEENLVSSFAQKQLCIKTKQADNILEKFKVIFKGNVYMARAKKLFAWTPIFLDHKESEYISNDESLHGEKYKSVGLQHGEDDLVDDSDVEVVSETFFGDKHPSPNNSVCNSSEKVVEQQSEDPFCIYDGRNKKPKGVAQDSDSSLSHPPGFTPEVSRQENDHIGVDLNTEIDKFIWGNSNYQYVSSDSAGGSGGILCVWEATIFKKDHATVSDNFIAIYGTWISNNSKVLIVFIYAPQSLSHKRVLWDNISSLIARWNGETIVMGDFNEVRSIDERFSSMFNQSSSRLFNHFIMSSGLVDVKLEGYSFTWAHPSATKMSKLDRFLVSEVAIVVSTNVVDRSIGTHNPRLLFQTLWFLDNHVTHLTFESPVELWGPEFPKGIDCENSYFQVVLRRFLLVQRSISLLVFITSEVISYSNWLIRFKKKLHDLKKYIRSWIKDKKLQQSGAINSIKEDLIDIYKNFDSGNVSNEILLKRMELTWQLHDINQMEAKDYVQK